MRGWLTTFVVFVVLWALFMFPGFLTGGYPVFPQLMPQAMRPYVAPVASSGSSTYDPNADPCAQVPNPCTANESALAVETTQQSNLMGAAAAAQTSSEYLMGEISVGQEGRVRDGNACTGDLDVSADGQHYEAPYRREPNPDWTGQITIFHADAYIFASTYPGSCFPLSELDNVKKLMAEDGCFENKGCRWFNEIVFE